MSFLSNESGTETSIPREGIEIVLPAATYRIATGTRDIVIDGATFRASPAGRAEARIAAAANQTDMEIVLPLSHAVPQRYMQSGVPPRTIEVTVYRQQTTSGEFETIWSGLVTSLAIDGHTAKLLVPATLSRALRRRIPTITAGRNCPHILYDLNCRVDREDFKLEATVTFVDGRSIDVVAAYPDGFATYGEVLHVASGERVTIAEQTTTGVDGVRVTMQLPLVGVAVGDAVKIYAGCAHSISACRFKFANVENYGGFPFMQFENFYGLFGAIEVEP